MEKVIAFVLVVGVCILAGLFLVGWAMDAGSRQANAQANLAYAQGQARAMVIEAQGQASLDRAQAFAITLNSGLPWGVLAVLGILGLSIVALAFVVVARTQQDRPRLIERVIIERLPDPGRRGLPQGDRLPPGVPALTIDESVFSQLED